MLEEKRLIGVDDVKKRIAQLSWNRERLVEKEAAEKKYYRNKATFCCCCFVLYFCS